MNSNRLALLIVIVLISVILWGVSLHMGWLKDGYYFIYNVYDSLINEEIAGISEDENVTTVKFGEFTFRQLSNIIIPNNITTIEDNAFNGNKLTSITIGKDVSLGKNAIGYGFEAIYNRNNQEAGTFTRIDHRSTDWTWDGDFSYRIVSGNITITDFKGSGTVNIPDKIHGNSVTGIGDNAFRDKKLTSVTIPNSITTIGREAFRNNQITVLIIGIGVTSIGNNAFDENSLTRVAIPDSVTTIGNEAFCCNQISNLTIGNSVTSIGHGAFGSGSKGKGQLTSIFLPNSVTNIGVNTFSGHRLTRVSIGENVTLGSGNNNAGILGEGTGFNSAYSNNNRRAGVYTRSNVQSTQWSRAAR